MSGKPTNNYAKRISGADRLVATLERTHDNILKMRFIDPDIRNQTALAVYRNIWVARGRADHLRRMANEEA